MDIYRHKCVGYLPIDTYLQLYQKLSFQMSAGVREKIQVREEGSGETGGKCQKPKTQQLLTSHCGLHVGDLLVFFPGELKDLSLYIISSSL